MKDSQHGDAAVHKPRKYIKVNNERFSMAPSVPSLLRYIEVNNERFLALNESPSGPFILTNMRIARYK